MSYAAQIPRVLGGVLRNRDLRRVELAFVGFNAAEWGVWIAMLVYAYEHGGATTAGLVALVQLVPAALFAPFAASLGDRRRPTRVLAAGYVAQGAAMSATAAVLLAGGPPLARIRARSNRGDGGHGDTAGAGGAHACPRPHARRAHGRERRLRLDREHQHARRARARRGAAGRGRRRCRLRSDGRCGARLGAARRRRGGAAGRGRGRGTGAHALRRSVVAREPGPRALVWLLGVEALAIGALDVLYVVLAVGVLGHSGSVAGYLNAAFGAGGVLGVAATVALVGRRRIAPALLVGLAVWAAALAAIAAAPSTAAAFLLLAAAGAGRTVLDVAGRTLLQRIAPPDALARVFGLLEGVSMAGLAVGSIAASGFVAIAGGRGAFVCLAALLPLAAGLVLRSVLRADGAVLPVVELARLRALPLFAPLGAPALEALARALEPVGAEAGATVIREGDPGDRFYVVADGELDVSTGGMHVGVLRRGDCFGEIALLRDVPRTATVVARTAVQLDALDKQAFVSAVTGHLPSARAADALVHGRLERATIAS